MSSAAHHPAQPVHPLSGPLVVEGPLAECAAFAYRLGHVSLSMCRSSRSAFRGAYRNESPDDSPGGPCLFSLTNSWGSYLVIHEVIPNVHQMLVSSQEVQELIVWRLTPQAVQQQVEHLHSMSKVIHTLLDPDLQRLLARTAILLAKAFSRWTLKALLLVHRAW